MHTGFGGRLHGKGPYRHKGIWDLAVQPTLRAITYTNGMTHVHADSAVWYWPGLRAGQVAWSVLAGGVGLSCRWIGGRVSRGRVGPAIRSGGFTG